MIPGHQHIAGGPLFGAVACDAMAIPDRLDIAGVIEDLGDAGDRLNGVDAEDLPRNMIQLLGDYGPNILSLYRSQVRKIEKTILG